MEVIYANNGKWVGITQIKDWFAVVDGEQYEYVNCIERCLLLEGEYDLCEQYVINWVKNNE